MAGVSAQHESEMVHHSIHQTWVDLAIIFTDTDSALWDCQELLRAYFGRGRLYRPNLQSESLNSTVGDALHHIHNWAPDVYNLVTKRAAACRNAHGMS